MQRMVQAAQCHTTYRAEFRALSGSHRIVSRVPSRRAATEERNQGVRSLRRTHSGILSCNHAEAKVDEAPHFRGLMLA